jgi:hypothetical protein
MLDLSHSTKLISFFPELDELMTSLNNFKMADRQVDEPVIPPNLDTMLGNLQVSFLKEQWHNAYGKELPLLVLCDTFQ